MTRDHLRKVGEFYIHLSEKMPDDWIAENNIMTTIAAFSIIYGGLISEDLPPETLFGEMGRNVCIGIR